MKKSPLGKQILLAADDPVQLEVLRWRLQDAGFSVSTSTDGIEALQMVSLLRPDLAVLALSLPELDGFAVCDILRRHASTASVPVILIVNHCSETAIRQALEFGADDCLPASIDSKRLIAKINESFSLDSRPARSIIPVDFTSVL